MRTTLALNQIFTNLILLLYKCNNQKCILINPSNKRSHSKNNVQDMNIDCLIYEMRLIKKKKPSFNTQSGSIRAKTVCLELKQQEHFYRSRSRQLQRCVLSLLSFFFLHIYNNENSINIINSYGLLANCQPLDYDSDLHVRNTFPWFPISA